MGVAYKKLAAQAEQRARAAEMNISTVEITAAHHKGVADQMRNLALEAIDLMRLVISASDVRPAPGVYFLLNAAGSVVYVGQSENVLFRMVGHKTKNFASVRMIEVHELVERLRLELRFIHLLVPPLNVALMNFNDAQDLLKSAASELSAKNQPSSEST